MWVQNLGSPRWFSVLCSIYLLFYLWLFLYRWGDTGSNILWLVLTRYRKNPSIKSRILCLGFRFFVCISDPYSNKIYLEFPFFPFFRSGAPLCIRNFVCLSVFLSFFLSVCLYVYHHLFLLRSCLHWVLISWCK